jgi:hypothetical protein
LSGGPQSSRTHAYFERALRLSPLDPMNFNNHVGIASAFQVAGQLARAADEFLRALHERPNAPYLGVELHGLLEQIIYYQKSGLPRVGDPSVMLIQGWSGRQRGSRDQNLWCGGSVAQG